MHRMEPLLPITIPTKLLDMADEVRVKAAQLQAILPLETAEIIGKLLRVTSSFYSNLIEGRFTEPVKLSESLPRRTKEELRDLAITHMVVQDRLERTVDARPDIPFHLWFSPDFQRHVHTRLFRGADPSDLLTVNGQEIVPGKFRDIDVQVGTHVAPEHSAVLGMMQRLYEFHRKEQDFRRQLIAVFAFHHRVAWVHPFADGNGRTTRLVTHMQLYKLGLASDLWSLSRGLAKRQSDFYERLNVADMPRYTSTDGRGALTERGLIEFIEFMLEVSLDQLTYMLSVLDRDRLRDNLARAVHFDENFVKAGIVPGAGRALYILLSQGSVRRADFKDYLGCGKRMASEQLTKLIELGVVRSETEKARVITPGLPLWFALDVFPGLIKQVAQP